MICRLPGTPLHSIAQHQLITAKSSSGSWFFMICDLLLKYLLPSPQSLLHYPPTKERFKSMVKAKVVDYWECQLRSEASNLQSLQFFKPEFMSLVKPHLLWSTCGSNPYEVHKAVIQARMLSGRYATDRHSRHWTSNTEGYCSLPSCSDMAVVGSLEHMLLHCPSLIPVRNNLAQLSRKLVQAHGFLPEII